MCLWVVVFGNYFVKKLLPFSFQFFTRLAAVFAEEVEDFRLVRYTVKHPPAIEPKNIKAIG